MSRYQPLGLPLGGDTTDLSRAVDAELYRISEALDRRFDQEVSSEVLKAQEGMLRYFDAKVFDPGQGTGEYVYSAGRWSKLADVANAYSYLPFKAYMFRYLAGTGADPEASFNIFSVTDEGLGTYRVTVDQSTIFGEDLLEVSVPLASVFPVNKVDEGFINVEILEFGVDGNLRSWLEYHLTETYVQGTALRARDYVLTAPEQLYGVGLANVQITGALPIPP